MKRDATRILKRSEHNPLLKVEDFPGVAQLYNPSPVKIGDEYLLLISVVEHATPITPGNCVGVGQTRIARSKDT